MKGHFPRDVAALNSTAVSQQIDWAEALLDELEALGDIGEVDVPLLLDGLGSAGLILARDPGIEVEKGRVTHGLVAMIRLGLDAAP